MSAKKRVAIAMSGGVDSGVAAALLKEQGYEVIAIHLKLYQGKAEDPKAKRCCSLDDALDARAVAARLDIPFYVLDYKTEFQTQVIDYFMQEYTSGRTPNPCVMCNRTIKIQQLLDKTKELGCDYLATGHYAKITQDPVTKRYQLKKPLDLRKDQTYFLHGTPASELPHLLFPLADYLKPNIREIASSFAEELAGKPDSQEVCFVPKDYRDFLQEHLSEIPPPGNFVTTEGQVLGTHRGLPYYTIGQRRGLGLSDETPYYVVRLDKEKNQVVVGKEDETYCHEVTVSHVNWVSIDPIEKPITATVKLRYSHQGALAEITPQARKHVHLQLKEPVRSVAPGQAAAFYDGDTLLGGGWIQSVSTNG